MTKEEFVEKVIFDLVRRRSFFMTTKLLSLAEAEQRGKHASLDAHSERTNEVAYWFNKLSGADQENVRFVIIDAIDSTIDRLLMQFTDQPKGVIGEEEARLELWYRDKDGKRLMLAGDEEEDYPLYEIFGAYLEKAGAEL